MKDKEISKNKQTKELELLLEPDKCVWKSVRELEIKQYNQDKAIYESMKCTKCTGYEYKCNKYYNIDG